MRLRIWEEIQEVLFEVKGIFHVRRTGKFKDNRPGRIHIRQSDGSAGFNSDNAQAQFGPADMQQVAYVRITLQADSTDRSYYRPYCQPAKPD